jgi:HAD superfamily hydrolase (TIGR01509 family)
LHNDYAVPGSQIDDAERLCGIFKTRSAAAVRWSEAMKYKCLVFDFFGVISSEVAPFWLAKHFSASDAATVRATIVQAADRGELSQDGLFSELAKLTGVPPAQIEREWQSYVHIDERMVSLIRAFASTCKLGLITNAPSPFVRGLIERNALAGLFSAIIVSSEVGLAKPDREIYERLLTLLSVNAADALMIDDNADNIAGAIAAGMDGLQFRSYEQLSASLLRFGWR